MTPNLKHTIICIVLLMFCSANTSFGINPQMLDSTGAHHYESLETFTAHQPDSKEKKIQEAQIMKETKLLDRSERYAKKISQKSHKAQRPGKGKQTGWFIFWMILGIGALLAAIYLFWISIVLSIVGGSGAGFVIIGALTLIGLSIASFVQLGRLKRKTKAGRSALPQHAN